MTVDAEADGFRTRQVLMLMFEFIAVRTVQAQADVMALSCCSLRCAAAVPAPGGVSALRHNSNHAARGAVRGATRRALRGAVRSAVRAAVRSVR